MFNRMRYSRRSQIAAGVAALAIAVAVGFALHGFLTSDTVTGAVDGVQETASQTVETAQSVADDARDTAENAKDTAETETKSLVERVGDWFTSLMQKLTDGELPMSLVGTGAASALFVLALIVLITDDSSYF